jgi:hypothetical protein
VSCHDVVQDPTTLSLVSALAREVLRDAEQRTALIALLQQTLSDAQTQRLLRDAAQQVVLQLLEDPTVKRQALLWMQVCFVFFFPLGLGCIVSLILLLPIAPSLECFCSLLCCLGWVCECRVC